MQDISKCYKYLLLLLINEKNLMFMFKVIYQIKVNSCSSVHNSSLFHIHDEYEESVCRERVPMLLLGGMRG